MSKQLNLAKNRYEWARETLENFINTDLPLPRVFDIGSRDAILEEYCSKLNMEYFGFDLEPLSDNIRAWNIENPFPYQEKKADIITFLEVIEHLDNPMMCIKNLASVLKQGGYLLLTTPNPAWSNARINLLFKGQLNCFTDEDLRLNHHVFTPWPHIVQEILLKNGFEVLNFWTLDGKTNIFSKPISPLRFPLQIGFRIIKRIIELVDNKSCGMSYALLAKKIDS